MGFPGGTVVKNPPANVGGSRDAGLVPMLARSLEYEMVAHFSIFAWKIPWAEKPGGLQPTESQRVGHN